VMKARNIETGQIVALKRMAIEQGEGISCVAVREIAQLNMIKCKNVVKLLDVIPANDVIHLIFEIMETDARQYLRMKKRFQGDELSWMLFQIMNGLEYCHNRGILHRDLKLQNLLINTKSCEVKIADFGLAREYSQLHVPYTQEVVTLWYRAPEILLGTLKYSSAVDIWSVGCIFYELFTGRVLFAGDSEIDTLFRMFRVLGTPTDKEWPTISKLPHMKNTFPKWKAKLEENVMTGVGQDGMEAFLSMLRYVFYFSFC
jgi:serine/threonine protein kinase